MSDPTTPPPGENPYGQPTQPPVYGSDPQQPSGPPPQPYGQQPYGGAPQADPAYGSAYGGSYGGSAHPGGADADKRPGTVTAASIITIVFSGLGLVFFGLVTIVLAVARGQIIDELETQLDGQAAFEEFTANDLANVLIVVFAIFAVWCLVAIVTAVLAMRGKNWARIVTVVSAAVSAVISLLGITSGLSALTLIAAVAAIVLYFTGGAGEWYRRQGARDTLPTGTTQPWG